MPRLQRMSGLLAGLAVLAACGGTGGGTLPPADGPPGDPPPQGAFQTPPNDPLFGAQWHLLNTGQMGAVAGQDSNVVPAWVAGRTGLGRRITIIDDGLDVGHEDLAANVISNGSLDLDNNDLDPTPRPGAGPNAPAHGTACGGVAAAVGHNAVGVTGVAPRAGVAGIRDNTGLDTAFATSVTYNVATTDAYNMSFGPPDTGGLFLLSAVQAAALNQGIVTGRGGLGTVYVVAAGNGGANDYANLDGSQNHFGVVTVGAVNAGGTAADYQEMSSSTLLCAPSSGSGYPAITTLDTTGANGYELPAGNYTTSFGGTSSAAPLVTGVVALMLEANPTLTWRDVRRILAVTARQNDAADGDWITNGFGEMVNHKYGYGVVDAGAAVAAAATWVNLPAVQLYASPVRAVNAVIPDNTAGGTTDVLPVAASGLVQADHVAVVLNLTHANFRNLRITLTSPSGTPSILTVQNPAPPAGAQPTPANVVLATNRLIGEVVNGNWTIQVEDLVAGTGGMFVDWQLVIRGH